MPISSADQERQNLIGLTTLTTNGHAEGAKCYSKSASLGNPEAQATPGLLYEEGDRVPEDWVKAAQLYRHSAEQNNAIGQSMLARAYEFGIRVPQKSRSIGIAVPQQITVSLFREMA
jgi:TPR repeat protein